MGAKLIHGACWGRQYSGCVAFAVSFSGFHLGCHPICCTDWTIMMISSPLCRICSSLDSAALATDSELSKSDFKLVNNKALNLKSVQYFFKGIACIAKWDSALNLQALRRNMTRKYRQMDEQTQMMTTVCLQSSTHWDTIKYFYCYVHYMYIVSVVTYNVFVWQICDLMYVYCNYFTAKNSFCTLWL